MSAQADETAVNHAPSDRSIKNGSLPMNNGSLPMHTQHHDLNHWGAAGHITPVYTGSNGDYPIPPAPYYPFSSNPYSTGEQQTWGFASYQNNTPHHTYGQQAPQTDQQIFPPQNAPQFGGPQGYNFFDYSNTWNPGNIITHTATDARGLKAEYYQPRSVYGIESYNQSGGDLSRGMATLSIGGSSAALQVGEGHITMGGFGPVIPAPPNAPMPQGPPKALSWADKVKQPPKPSDYKSKRGPIGGTGGGRGVPEPQPLLPQGLWNGPAPALPRPTGPRGDAWSNNSPIPNNHIQSTVRRPPLTNNLGSPPETNHIRHNQVYNTTNGKEEVEPDSDVLQQLKRETNPPEINMNLKGARFFVIKSYSEDDVHRSIKYGIWCSTEGGNKRLEAAWKERNKKGPIYLFYSVNASGHFCGIAEMMSSVDYSKQSSVWAQDKWKGLFKVRWIYVKDVPNASLRHIRLENNENKPVTNSRDTQEMLGEKGRMVLKVIHSFKHTTSLFDDFAHYEKRQQEEDNRKRHEAPPKGGKGERHE